jgi:hypothetical protein
MNCFTIFAWQTSRLEELILGVTILPTYIVNHALCIYSLNYVTVADGRGYQGFCDNSTRALLLKNVMMGREGVKNYQKLRDVIYGLLLMALKIQLFQWGKREYERNRISKTNKQI